jgi:hypothetical protein
MVAHYDVLTATELEPLNGKLSGDRSRRIKVHGHTGKSMRPYMKNKLKKQRTEARLK